jgi:hypothetical protein
VAAGPDGRRDVRCNARTRVHSRAIAARDAAPLEEAARVRSFYEGQSAKRPNAQERDVERGQNCASQKDGQRPGNPPAPL